MTNTTTPPRVAEQADERALFEAWADAAALSTRTNAENGAYVNYRTQTCWEAWQARATQKAVPEAPTLPIYQVQFHVESGSSAWHDASEAAYHTVMPERRRIVYVSPVAAPEAPASEQQTANNCPHDGLKCAIDGYCDKCPLLPDAPTATTASLGYSKKWCERMAGLESAFDGDIEAGATRASASEGADRAEQAAILGTEKQCRDELLVIADKLRAPTAANAAGVDDPMPDFSKFATFEEYVAAKDAWRDRQKARAPAADAAALPPGVKLEALQAAHDKQWHVVIKHPFGTTWARMGDIRDVKLAELLASAPSTPTATSAGGQESGWCIERGPVSAPKYLHVNGGMLDWTQDNMKALRFARRADAEQVTEIVEDADRIAEHVWMDTPAANGAAGLDGAA